MTSAARRILLITFDVIGPRIGGSAIRVLGLARALAEVGHSVTIAAPRVDEGYPDQPFLIRAFEISRPRETLRPFLEDAAVTVLPLHGLARLPFLKSAKNPLVFDLYDPVLFELMEADSEALLGHVQLLKRVLRRGDFFLCASERQRDFWLGAITANGRIAAESAADQERRDLIDVVPFGIDPTPITPAGAGRSNLTAVIPALASAEKVIVWPGGIWDWTDPEIVMTAMRIIAQRSPKIHLVLFAGKHPTEGHIDTAAKAKAQALATEFQLNGRSVHFIDDYVPYQERGKYLSECDAAVSTHRTNLESRFAYRTRLLDCIWACLPIVCTEGDVLSEMVVRHGLGIVVPADDAEALARAIERIATDTEFAASCRTQIVESRDLFKWNDAVKPLARFCGNPRVTNVARPFADTGMLALLAWSVLKTYGARETWRKLKQYLRSR